MKKIKAFFKFIVWWFWNGPKEYADFQSELSKATRRVLWPEVFGEKK